MTQQNDLGAIQVSGQTDDLLPCPFCGEARIFLNEPSKHHRYGSINCPACLVVMPGEVKDQSELIGCWNARAALSTAGDTGREAVPVAWAVFTQDGNIRLWSKHKGVPQAFAAEKGLVCTPLFTSPQPAPRIGREEVIEECAKLAEKQAFEWFNGEATTTMGQGYQNACRAVATKLRALTASAPAGGCADSRAHWASPSSALGDSK